MINQHMNCDLVSIGTFKLIFVILILFGSSAVIAAPVTGELCWTEKIYQEKMAARAAAGIAVPDACSQLGNCDNPTFRDDAIPGTTDPITYIRLYFNVFAEDDGANPATTVDNIQTQVALLNVDYLPMRIQFVYDFRFINLTAFRYITANSEFNTMKNAFAVDPGKQCNIYVVSVNIDGSVFSFGNFPWDGDELSATGGVVMNRTQFYPFGTTTLSHEIGHNLGLWHTHHGVSEVTECGACYEAVGALDRDLTGDLCADTDPTPTNFSCSTPGGLDPCSGFSWTAEDLDNIMSYTSCRSVFTPQQHGRIQCWTFDRLIPWMVPAMLTANNSFGTFPLTVDFSAESGFTVNSWDWDFGDGGSGSGQTPAHQYTTPGFFTVDLTLSTTLGSFIESAEGLVSIYADSVFLSDAEFIGDTAFVELSVHNFLPLKMITIPIDYGNGDLDLRYIDIVPAGTRTAGFIVSTTNDWFANRKAVVRIDASTNPLLVPGNDVVATMKFVRVSGTSPGNTEIAIQSYPAGNPELKAAAGIYPPETTNGSVFISCCTGKVGNANLSGGDIPTVADITEIIDHLFGAGLPLGCYLEADVNQSGGFSPGSSDITVADITLIIDHLFGIGNPLPDCP